MKDEFIYFFKGMARALGQAFCFNVLLPIWYVLIKIKERI